MKKGKYVYYRCTGFRGACGNVYVREERLAELLAEVIKPIQISEDVAADIAAALRSSDAQVQQEHDRSRQQLEHRRRVIAAKIDRAYDDFVSERISEDFWKRHAKLWEAEVETIDRELSRLQQRNSGSVAEAEKIFELAKKAENLYKSQDPTEQRRLLETVLSNCTFDRGSLRPTYTSPFDLLVKGNETGNWRRGWDSNPRAGYPTTRFRGAPVTTTSVPLR